MVVKGEGILVGFLVGAGGTEKRGIVNLDLRTAHGQRSGFLRVWQRESTLHTLVTLRNRAPITAISVERVKFDIQKLNNPEISEVKYQSGMLLGYEVRVSFVTARKTIARQKEFGYLLESAT